MTGRKPTPTALFVLRGKPSHGRKLNKAEPIPPAVDQATPPRWLGEEGKKVWAGLISVVASMKVLTRADLDALAALCSCYEEFLSAKQARRGTKGREVSMDRWQRQLRLWMVEFGLTPSARSRLQVVATRDHDPIVEYLKRGKPS